MSKVLPAGLEDHLKSGSSTMVYCWKVTRTDGTVQTFTECDIDVSFGGDTYVASTGFTASTVQSELGLNVDNLNVDSVLSSDTINEDDLAAGNYDGAQVELYWVNFNDTAMNVMIMKGNIGEVKRRETSFSAELRSLSHFLQQKSGKFYSKEGIIEEAQRTTSSGTVSSVSSNRIFAVTGVTPSTDGFFNLGQIEFTSGLNNGISRDVKLLSGGQVTLWEAMPFNIVGSDTFTIKSRKVYSADEYYDEFGDMTDFRGFPHIPGNDFVTKYPTRGGSDQNGGSIFS